MLFSQYLDLAAAMVISAFAYWSRIENVTNGLPSGNQ